MLQKYIRGAMGKAKYEIFPDDGAFYGEIPDCPGVYANTSDLETCREELESVLEGWIILGLAMRHTLPVIDGIDLNVREVA